MSAHPFYIDPNTGGILFQFLAVALAGITGFLMIFSRKIREGIARLRRGTKKDDKTQN